MRFLAEGPSIPDELLVARDEGRVVFFCGAGVSRARAQLPDFFGLATKVSDILGVESDSPARRLIEVASTIDEEVGISGLLAADRVFGLLEQEFRLSDIETAVANELQSDPDVDLSAHKILMNLARTPTGETRLVTTNFDLLFERCDESCSVWQPPGLPDPLRATEFDGIIHLHGRMNEAGSGAYGDGFVLSSSEFGRAYLAEGWATKFVQDVLDRYLVVFVGYTANDPPIQYLLEALRAKTNTGRAFAFQSGDASEAESKWRHKGVEAIAYSDQDNHAQLWDSLEAWSNRAKDPAAWYTEVTRRAQDGPSNLAPHERGQVAHVVSTTSGARQFATAEPVPPAEWLCVFDPRMRFSAPGRSRSSDEFVDPFEIYGIDSDPVPPKVDPEEILPKREIPEGVWDGLSLSRLDRRNLDTGNFSALQGHWAINQPQLANRVFQLGIWIGKVSHEPASVWWAAGQVGLHEEIRNQIAIHLERTDNEFSANIRKAWRYLFEVWDTRPNEFHRDWYALKAVVKKDDWSPQLMRELESVYRPHFKARRPFGVQPADVIPDEPGSLSRLLRLEVEYPNQHEDPDIPDEWLALGTQIFRAILQHAMRLENEIGGYALSNISPVMEDDAVEGDIYQRDHGISKCMLFLVELFGRLADFDGPAARRESDLWPLDEGKVFPRLRVWAARDTRLYSADEFATIVSELPRAVFWDYSHARDLLLSLADRWHELGNDERRRLEDVILKGAERWDGETDDDYEERRARSVLNRIHWLRENKCEFCFDFDAVDRELQQSVSNWRIENAQHAADSTESGGGSVRRDTDPSNLLTGPLNTVIERAKNASEERRELLVENDPFAGLSKNRPLRALSALTVSCRAGDSVDWAWRTFLQSQSREGDPPKLSALIAHRIVRLPDDSLIALLRPVCDWYLRVTPTLLSKFLKAYRQLWVRLLELLATHPSEELAKERERIAEHSWADSALNSPVGFLVQSHLKDPERQEFTQESGLREGWVEGLEQLLNLGGAFRRHTLVFLAFDLNWLYWIDARWTEAHVLSSLDGDNHDKDAFWDGFFWGANVPTRRLYLRLKDELLSLAKSRDSGLRDHTSVLAGMVLAGWCPPPSGDEGACLSDEELRRTLIETNEDMRCQVLWQLQKWAKKSDDENASPWPVLLPQFLSEVWPRQQLVNSPRVTEQLVELAFSQEEDFPRIVELVLPLASKIDRDHIALPHIGKKGESVIDKHPGAALALLSTVLPPNVRSWPYGVDEALTTIAEADPALVADARYIELKRAWDDR